MKIDYTEERKSEIELHQLEGIDNPYIFYYDESNNHRKVNLDIKKENFFDILSKNFALGGIVKKQKSSLKIEVDKLIQDLNFQPNQKEIKSKNFFNSKNKDFLQCMNSKRLGLLLKWLDENELYIHYIVENNLYWGIVDIIESLNININSNEDVQYIYYLKYILYIYAKKDISKLYEILKEYGYPNIKREDFRNFLNKLIFWLYNIELLNLEHEKTIKKLIELIKKEKELFYLTDNKNYEFVEGYENLYISRIYNFLNSKHIFDIEKRIIEKIGNPLTNEKGEFEIECNKILLKNYQFEDSQSNVFIQISDIIIGVIAKLYDYLDKKSVKQIEEDIKKFHNNEKNNIKKLLQIIDKSQIECKAFIAVIAPFYEIDLKFNKLYEELLK